MSVLENVSMIAAIGKNNELGKDNNLIWLIKEDLKFFKEYTWGKQMVMGYNTFYSLRSGKPLPGRKHIILTKNHENDIEKNDQIYIVNNLSALLEYIENYKEEIVVIGGSSLYKNMLEYAKKLIITRIDASAVADVYFPEIKEDDWTRKTIYENHEEGFSYKREIYIRK